MRFWEKYPLYKQIKALLHWLAPMQISLYAAYTCFYMVLSLLPALVLLLNLLRYAGLEAESLISIVEGFLPDVLVPEAKRLIRATYLSTSGMGISLSAVATLWSAGRGIYGLMLGLNSVYGVQEQRGYLNKRLMSMGYTFAFFVVLLLTLLLTVFGGSILQALPLDSRLFRFLDDLIGLRFLLLFLLQTCLFTAMFMALPNTQSTFRQALPGAVLSSFGWLTFSKIYSVYVAYSSEEATLFGPVYTLAVGMLWIYFCISIVLYGGALNRACKAYGK